MGNNVGHQQIAKFLLSILFSLQFSATLEKYNNFIYTESKRRKEINADRGDLLHKMMKDKFKYIKVDRVQLVEH